MLMFSRYSNSESFMSFFLKTDTTTALLHTPSDEELRIIFNVLNEYLTTEIIVVYNSSLCGVEFLGGYTGHNGLESLQWFRDEVRKFENQNGYKFEFCFKGHRFNQNGGKLLVMDDFDSMVMFKKDEHDDHYAYRVDFGNRKLEEYPTYPFYEYFAFFG